MDYQPGGTSLINSPTQQRLASVRQRSALPCQSGCTAERSASASENRSPCAVSRSICQYIGASERGAAVLNLLVAYRLKAAPVSSRYNPDLIDFGQE